MPDFGRWTSNGGDPSLNEINRTDRFLDSLAHQQPVYATDHAEAELAHLLSGWRDDVRDAPLSTALTPRDALIALENARATRRRNRTFAVVGSAAAAVLCLGGFVGVVAGAEPGDSLYGLRTMFFGEEQDSSRDDAVVLAAQTEMAEVQKLINDGQWDAAQQKLETLTTTVNTVNDVEAKQDLVSEWQELTVKVEAQDPAATVPPGVPPPEFPDIPVVVLDTPTPSDATTTSESPTSTSNPSDTTTPSTPGPSDTTTPSTPPTPSTSGPSDTSTSPVEPTIMQPPVTTATSAPTRVTPPPVTSIPATTPAQTLPPTTQTILQTPTPAPPPVVTQAPPPPVEPPAPPPPPPTRAPAPTSAPVVEEPEAPQERPTQQAPAPRPAITTTFVPAPEPDTGSGEG